MPRRQETNGLGDGSPQEGFLQNAGPGASTSSDLRQPRRPLHVPPYDPDNAEAWFRWLDKNFARLNIIDDEEKFFAALGYLDMDTHSTLAELIDNPPPNAYSALKNRLLELTAPTTGDKLKCLFEERDLGSLLPTAYLDKIKLSLGPSTYEQFERTNEALLKAYFLSKLPTPVRTLLSLFTDDMTLSGLAKKADNFILNQPKSIPASLTVNGVSDSDHKFKVIESQLYSLGEAVKGLTQRLDALEGGSRPGGGLHGRGRSPSHQRTYNPNGKLCYPHFKYGTFARNCVPPCAWRQTHTQTTAPTQATADVTAIPVSSTPNEKGGGV